MSQLVLHRLLTVASSCADGVAVVLDLVEDELLLPPPQEARRMDKKARLISFVMGILNLVWAQLWRYSQS